MVVFELDGIVTSDGKLEIELPEGITPGKVRVRIEPAAQPNAAAEAEALAKLLSRPPTWTDEELAELLKPEKPKTGAEIAARIRAEGGGWEHKGITDSAAWVEEQRRKRRERRTW